MQSLSGLTFAPCAGMSCSRMTWHVGGPPRPGMPPPQFAQRPPGQGAPQFMPPAGFRPGMPPQRPGMPPPGMPPPGVSRELHNLDVWLFALCFANWTSARGKECWFFLTVSKTHREQNKTGRSALILKRAIAPQQQQCGVYCFSA